jgi:transcriptional regulator with XRE-family HTH domain
MARGEEESARKFVNWPEAHRRRKAAQVASGKSIVDIAEVIGVTDGYLGLFIRTREIGAMDILLGLAQELNTTTDYLLAAPWAGNSARPDNLRFSEESMRAMRLLDALPRPARQHLLEMLTQAAEVWRATAKLQADVLRYAAALEEAGIDLDLDNAPIGEVTIGEFLADALRNGEA